MTICAYVSPDYIGAGHTRLISTSPACHQGVGCGYDFKVDLKTIIFAIDIPEESNEPVVVYNADIPNCNNLQT